MHPVLLVGRTFVLLFMQAAILATLSGCTATPEDLPVHWAGPVPDPDGALATWQGLPGGQRLVRGETAMLEDHAQVLDADAVVRLVRDSFGHSDDGWYVVAVDARAPDPWVLSWAIQPEPIVVVFLPTIRDAAAWSALQGHDVGAADIAHWGMLHAGGHLLGIPECRPGPDCGIMDPAFSHGVLLLDALRADTLPAPAFLDGDRPGPLDAVSSRRPV